MANKSHYDPAHKRVFVREISGEYSLKHELKRLRELPRVQKSEQVTFQSGPQAFSKHFMEPEDGLGQTLHIHLEEYAPGGKSQMHGHVNEAIFYILDGKGYEIHDGIRYDWKAGDIAVVHNNCVHQHNNADEHAPARALVIKTKPMYMFMNMLFQQRVTERPKEPSPTQGDFVPREDVDHNRPWYHEHEHDHVAAHAHDHGGAHAHSGNGAGAHADAEAEADAEGR